MSEPSSEHVLAMKQAVDSKQARAEQSSETVPSSDVVGQVVGQVVVQIVVNGLPVTSSAVTLADLLVELGYSGQRIATARNSEFVAERVRSMTTIEENDRIEIVSPRQGG
jgi:sulfur carrier protein